MNRRSDRSTSRSLRVATLALAVMAVLTASVLPACADGSCCANAGQPTVQTQMPCCSETSLTSRDAIRLLPATSGGSSLSLQKCAPAAVAPSSGATVAPARVDAGPAVASSAHGQLRPPLFLLNAQFLI